MKLLTFPSATAAFFQWNQRLNFFRIKMEKFLHFNFHIILLWKIENSIFIAIWRKFSNKFHIIGSENSITHSQTQTIGKFDSAYTYWNKIKVSNYFLDSTLEKILIDYRKKSFKFNWVFFSSQTNFFCVKIPSSCVLKNFFSKIKFFYEFDSENYSTNSFLLFNLKLYILFPLELELVFFPSLILLMLQL